MRTLAIKTLSLDWLNIIDLALKRQAWGKSYTLYQMRDVSIVAEMQSINFLYDRADIKIRIDYKEDEYYEKYDSYTTVSYYLKNFSADDFRRILLRNILTLIRAVERSRTRMKAHSLYTKENISYWHIEEEDYIKAGLQKTYSVLNTLKDSTIKNALVAQLDKECADVLNKPNTIAADNYCATHTNSVKGLSEIAKSIEKELEVETDF